MIGFAVALLGGGALAIGGLPEADGEIEACYVKKGEKQGKVRLLVEGKCKRRKEKSIAWNREGPPGPPGSQGETGQTGAPGQDATNLFAYIRDNGDGAAAVTEYGSGVTSVSEGMSPGVYTVAFDRSLAGCVVQANVGLGDPPGSGSSTLHAVPDIRMNGGAANDVQLTFRNLAEVNVDTSFLITAFC